MSMGHVARSQMCAELWAECSFLFLNLFYFLFAAAYIAERLVHHWIEMGWRARLSIQTPSVAPVSVRLTRLFAPPAAKTFTPAYLFIVPLNALFIMMEHITFE